MRKTWKTLPIFLVLCVLSLSLVWAGGGSEAADSGTDQITLRFASVSSPPGQFLNSDGVQWWMDEVIRRTNGRVKFDATWNSALGDPTSYLNLLEEGVVDVVMGCRIYTPGRTPLGPFLYVIPFGPTDPALVSRAKRQVQDEFPEFDQELARNNAILVANFVTLPYNIASKTPIRSLSDLEGRKIGLIGRYFGQWASPTGLVPVVAPMTERYNLLQSGVTEMDFHPITHMNAFNVQEQTQYYVRVEAMVGAPWDLMFNRSKFESLPADIQEIILETGREAEIMLSEQFAHQTETKLESEWADQGIVFMDFPAEERAKWSALVDDIPAQWAAEMEDKGLPGWEIMHRFQEITTELGYEWSRNWAVRN